MVMEDLVCKRCGSVEYRTEPSGPHVKALCKHCGAYIKFIPQPIAMETLDLSKEIVPMGKHKGKAFDQVLAEDRSYLEWMRENIRGRPGKLAAIALEGR